MIAFATSVWKRFHRVPGHDFVLREFHGKRYMGAVVACALLSQAAPMQAQGTPPYFPPGSSSPKDQKGQAKMPPDTTAPEHTKLSAEEAQQQMQKKIDDEPQLKGAAVLATVNDTTVVLSGRVADANQHDAAIRIARSYSGTREIVDKITIAEE